MTTSRESAHLWESEEYPGLLLLHARYEKQSFARHTHEEFVVGMNDRGGHSFFCRAATHPVPPGTVALVNPEEVHTGQVLGNEGWHYRGFYPPVALLYSLWQEATGRPARELVFRHPVVNDRGLCVELRAAHAALERCDTDGLERGTRLVHALTALMLRYSDRRTSIPDKLEHGPVRRARQHIEANFTVGVSLRELSGVAGLDRYRLICAFRATYGMPPYEYVTSLRVSEARRLLASGWPIARAACAAGFVDQSHLARQFKRHVGVTPGAFVRATRRCGSTLGGADVAVGRLAVESAQHRPTGRAVVRTLRAGASALPTPQ